MRRFAHRFFWKTDSQRFEPFLPFFTLLNLAIGVLFAFGVLIPPVVGLQLFTALPQILPGGLSATAWGIGLIVTFIGHCLEMYWRARGIGPMVAMTGFILWLYALTVYVSQASVLGILAIALPQLFFWAWYYVSAKDYRRQYNSEEIEGVS